MRRKLFIAVAVTAATLATGAGSVFAGEVTGNGQKSEFSQGASICKFSALNDDPSAPGIEGGRVQSFGQLVRQLGPQGGVPGTACNPTKSSGEPG
jgi:hypothetical protein